MMGLNSRLYHGLSRAVGLIPGASKAKESVAEQLGTRFLNRGLQSRRKFLTERFILKYGNRVQGGPFAGMELPDEASWGDGDRLPKLLGVYESELHSVLARIIESGKYRTIINVGCAEGYYAIGLARAVPTAEVYAFDTLDAAQRVCTLAAQRNGVADRLTVLGQCTIDTLNGILIPNRKGILVLDCEGAEMDLLQPSAIPQLRNSDILVECHDFKDRRITPLLLERFAAGYTIARIEEGTRGPLSVPFLRQLGTFDRLLAVCEFRPELMHWLFCTSIGET